MFMATTKQTHEEHLFDFPHLIQKFNHPLLIEFLASYSILFAAMLVAVNFRLRIPFGKTLGDIYVAQPPLLYPFMIFSVLVVTAFAASLRGESTRFSFSHRMALQTFAALMIATGFIVTFLPDVSLLQMAYFESISIGFIFLIYVLFPRLRDPRYEDDIQAYLMKLYHNRALLTLWIRYTIRSRYSQTFLGIIWIIIQPLSLSLVLALVFGKFLPRMDVGEVNFVSFFLPGFVAWQLFSHVIIIGTNSMIRGMGLINQVYFPREVLILVHTGEALVDLVFTFAAMLVVNGLVGLWPNPAFIYLPILIFIQLTLMLGFVFYLSFFAVLIRDIPQLIGVILRVMFYLTPVIYPADRIPENLRWLILFNPLVPVINGYREVILFNRPPDWVALYYPFVVGMILMFTGYLYFKANESKISDYV
ncbi:MAG: hypothetical protein CUN54_00090 [Phototrophicales bacterium]|nr:MAG: hypothetical protein CUN54_00090 [Phototrophicales bacterium]